MKKFLFVVGLFICTTAFANSASLAEVLSWKYGNCAGTMQEPGQRAVITSWNCSETQPSEAEIDVMTEEYVSSQSYYVKRFNAKILLGSVYQALAPESTLKLAPYTGALQSMMDWDNFSGIKALIDGLVAQGTMTEEEQKIVTQCFLDQGIEI